MRRNLAAYRPYQVFLNYPFDRGYANIGDALNFAVVAAGLLPVCALDLTTPDRPRLEMLVDAISNCHYSVHDLSRAHGEEDGNFARMNMPIEMGLALYPALHSQRHDHRCAFFIETPNDYKKFASDLAGLDPQCHNGSDLTALTQMYEWLRGVVAPQIFNDQPAVVVLDRFAVYRDRIGRIQGSGVGGCASHAESREIMYCVCAEESWWDWRATKAGKAEFPPVPLSWKGGRK
jgi:hypothetical protein